MYKREKMIALVAMALVIAGQLYLLISGDVAMFLDSFPTFFLYMAAAVAVGTAAQLAQLEFGSPDDTITRKTRVWQLIVQSLSCAVFIGIWSLPRLVIPLVVFVFLITDLVAFRIVQESVRSLSLRRGA